MPRAQGCAGAAHAQEKVRLGTSREAGLDHVRYIAMEHMDVRRDAFQDATTYQYPLIRVTRVPSWSRFVELFRTIPINLTLRSPDVLDHLS